MKICQRISSTNYSPPQVAAKSNNHLKVFKIVKNKKTSTVIKNLSFKERVSEIASMLSGDQTAERL